MDSAHPVSKYLVLNMQSTYRSPVADVVLLPSHFSVKV